MHVHVGVHTKLSTQELRTLPAALQSARQAYRTIAGLGIDGPFFFVLFRNRRHAFAMLARIHVGAWRYLAIAIHDGSIRL